MRKQGTFEIQQQILEAGYSTTMAGVFQGFSPWTSGTLSLVTCQLSVIDDWLIPTGIKTPGTVQVVNICAHPFQCQQVIHQPEPLYWVQDLLHSKLRRLSGYLCPIHGELLVKCVGFDPNSGCCSMLHAAAWKWLAPLHEDIILAVWKICSLLQHNGHIMKAQPPKVRGKHSLQWSDHNSLLCGLMTEKDRLLMFEARLKPYLICWIKPTKPTHLKHGLQAWERGEAWVDAYKIVWKRNKFQSMNWIEIHWNHSQCDL